ncbi:hypothetical protein A4S06_03940 [Erysipelotrichaceae bacterium MTC7]|nr:hypothetical protein A4S06_03940 [Erysipelotrichaceae bacterium MTC7]
MILEHLQLSHFRNYDQLQMQFNQGIHLFYGRNGQGKTNILEAIYYLSCTKSHRVRHDEHLIEKNFDYFSLKGKIKKDDRQVALMCNVNMKGKHLFLYDKPVSKVSEYIGFFNAIMFYPDDLLLFSQAPKKRRQFIDLELGKLSLVYTNALNAYYKLIKEKNKYLKNHHIDDVFLDTLDEQLIDLQVKIMKQRFHFIEMLMEHTKAYFKMFENQSLVISCQYESDVVYHEDETLLKKEIQAKLKSHREKEKVFHTSLVGVHRDNFTFLINDEKVENFASQGQKRMYILSLKLGMLQSIYQIKKEYPVLLLDDVFSELDDQKQEILLSILSKEVQVFITSTDRVKLKNSHHIQYYEVRQGHINKEDTR